MVVERIFPQHPVKVASRKLFVEQRELQIAEIYRAVIKGKNLVFIRAKIHRIAKRKGIVSVFPRRRFRLRGSRFPVQDFTGVGLLGKLLAAFFPLFFISGANAPFPCGLSSGRRKSARRCASAPLPRTEKCLHQVRCTSCW